MFPINKDSMYAPNDKCCKHEEEDIRVEYRKVTRALNQSKKKENRCNQFLDKNGVCVCV
jgi:hypothetical protein